MNVNLSLSLCRMWEGSPLKWTGREWESHFWSLRLCCRWSDYPSFCCLKVCVFLLCKKKKKKKKIHSQSRIEVCHPTEPPKYLVISQIWVTLCHITLPYITTPNYFSHFYSFKIFTAYNRKEPNPTNTLTKKKKDINKKKYDISEESEQGQTVLVRSVSD